MVSVFLQGPKVTDVGLVHLKELTRLEGLGLHHTQITDAGLVHLKGMNELEWLDLNGTAVTDAGLAHLKDLFWNVRLTKLEELG